MFQPQSAFNTPDDWHIANPAAPLGAVSSTLARFVAGLKMRR